MSHHRRYHPHHSPEHSGSPTCAKHSGSPTCGHSWVQHWFLPRVNLLPGKSIGPQGHAITTVAVVLIKGTATCKQKRMGKYILMSGARFVTPVSSFTALNFKLWRRLKIRASKLDFYIYFGALRKSAGICRSPLC